MRDATWQRREEALDRSAKGDTAAFEVIVREFQGMVFSLAYHLLHDAAAAEEIGQEVFLNLYQNLSSIESPDHLAFWLRKVTVHRSIDRARQEKFTRVSLEEAPDPPVASAPSDPWLAERLAQFVATLPARARTAVVLRFQEELELHEIAEIMEIPLNTVKSCLKRSLALLRAKLSRRLGGEVI